MSIYLTGDTHGEIRRLASGAWELGKTLTKDDYLIILGDFGVLWATDKQDSFDDYWLQWLSNKPWTTLFLDGNHENFSLIDALPTVEMLGASVGQAHDTVFHLKRGNIYTINDQTFFVLGGAASIDKAYRTTNISWWAREQPSEEEIANGWRNLGEVDFKVDYVLTHTIPFSLKKYFVLEGMTMFHDPLEHELEKLFMQLEFKHHYFGHWHQNTSLTHSYDDEKPKHTCLYENIIKLGEYYGGL